MASLFCIFRKIKLPSVQHAVSSRGRGRGGRGGKAPTRGGRITRSMPKSDVPVVKEEPLSSDPTTVDESDEQEIDKKEEKKDFQKKQIARRGKPYHGGIRKIINKKVCEVSLLKDDARLGLKTEKKKMSKEKDENEIDVEGSEKVKKLEVSNKETNEKEEKKEADEINENERNAKEETDAATKEDVKIEIKEGDVEITPNIDDIGVQVEVETDNEIHQEIETKETFQIETLAGMHGYVNEEENSVEVSLESEAEKKERMAVIGDSLTIKQLEKDIDDDLVNKLRVLNTEERIQHLKQLLALLQCHQFGDAGELIKVNEVDDNSRSVYTEDQVKSVQEEDGSMEKILNKGNDAYVNDTNDIVQEVKKQVRFDLLEEDETKTEDNCIGIQVEDIVTNVLSEDKENDNGEDRKQKIDELYENFPSSQANVEKFMQDFKSQEKKEEGQYKVVTEDISDVEDPKDKEEDEETKIETEDKNYEITKKEETTPEAVKKDEDLKESKEEEKVPVDTMDSEEKEETDDKKEENNNSEEKDDKIENNKTENENKDKDQDISSEEKKVEEIRNCEEDKNSENAENDKGNGEKKEENERKSEEDKTENENIRKMMMQDDDTSKDDCSADLIYCERYLK